MNTLELPSLLRIKVAADVLGMSDKTVRRLIDSGKLESVKIRGLRMVRESSLRVLMEKGTA
jgi:excisionase family DNA binding protein